VKLSRKTFKFLVNLYPPYIGAGVNIEYVSQDWKELRVSMPLRWYNRNAVGTQFGGSLYSMVDPHLMLLLMRLLGKAYLVWDKSASIDFVKPGISKVTANIRIPDDTLGDILEKTRNGGKHFATFSIDIVDSANEIVARVSKVIYIRRKLSFSKDASA
jgi:acyl-coenzyme A thioesterase PaaI-like protein